MPITCRRHGACSATRHNPGFIRGHWGATAGFGQGNQGHCPVWTSRRHSGCQVEMQGGSVQAGGPTGGRGAPEESAFSAVCSDLHPRCLPENCPWRMGSDGSARRAWPAAPRGQRVRAALGDPTPANQPGLWWLESHGDGPGLQGRSQGRASPLARSSGEPSCSCCVLNLGDIRLQTHTCSPNHRLRHPESQVCPLQVTAARGTEARPPPRASASYSQVRSSGIRCL